jgi:AcrR family transcriptional regulator
VTALRAETDKPVGPRSAKGVQTRARLVSAAKQVFEEDGFLDARVSDIAEGAGLSHGSFYHYFESKEEVFREVAVEVDERLGAPLANVIFDQSSHATPRDRIHEAMRRYFESYRAESRIMGVIEQVSRYDDEVGALRRSRHQHYSQLIAESIRQLQRRGRADEALSPAIAAAALGAMAIRFAEVWLVQRAVACDSDHAVDQLTLLFENAMQLDKGTHERHRAPVVDPERPGTT